VTKKSVGENKKPLMGSGEKEVIKLGSEMNHFYCLISGWDSGLYSLLPGTGD
jgi:hypothetical protein